MIIENNNNKPTYYLRFDLGCAINKNKLMKALKKSTIKI